MVRDVLVLVWVLVPLVVVVVVVALKWPTTMVTVEPFRAVVPDAGVWEMTRPS